MSEASRRPSDLRGYFTDRGYAESFGDEAERYERSRPGYPAALVDDLMSEGPRQVLDVGCGTGKAGRLFAQRGCAVLGVEPDERMAAVARRNGLTVETAIFEDWNNAGRRFDLLISAQAWHWVDPVRGVAKAAAVLRPGGRIALIWTLFKHQPHVKAAFERVYAKHAPSLAEESGVLGTVRRGSGSSYLADLARTRRFERPDLRSHTREHTYTRDEWLDQLPTHHDHAALGPARLIPLLDAVAEAVDGLGGSIAVVFDVWVITAVRRDQPGAPGT